MDRSRERKPNPGLENEAALVQLDLPPLLGATSTTPVLRLWAPEAEQLPDVVVLIERWEVEELHVLAFATCVVNPFGMTSITPSAMVVARRTTNLFTLSL